MREKYTNTSSKDLLKRAKKTALRLDGVQSPLGYFDGESYVDENGVYCTTEKDVGVRVEDLKETE